MAEEKLIVTFDTIADAMAMESICQEQKINGRLIPTPRSLSAGCGISWCCDIIYENQLLAIINSNETGQVKIDGYIQRITNNK